MDTSAASLTLSSPPPLPPPSPSPPPPPPPLSFPSLPTPSSKVTDTAATVTTIPSIVSSSTSNPSSSPVPKRRTLPPRLGQISNLLAGSALEEELLTPTPSSPPHSILSPLTRLILTSATSPAVSCLSFSSSSPLPPPPPPPLSSSSPSSSSPSSPCVVNVPSYFSDPLTLSRLQQTAVIETPEFRPRTDLDTLLPRTRSLKTDQDTSDSYYERKHRRGEVLEKRQRKHELDRLIRERNQLRERIELLKTVDDRLLLPILAERERIRSGGVVITDTLKSTNGVQAIRRQLLDEAKQTLSRYEFLLSSSSSSSSSSSTTTATSATTPVTAAATQTPSQEKKRKIYPSSSSLSQQRDRRPRPDSYDDDLDDKLFTPSTPSVKIRIKRPQPLAPKQTPTLLDASKPPVIIESIHHNIHARTTGGRFAPKSSASKVKAKSKSIPSPSTITNSAIRIRKPQRATIPPTGTLKLGPSLADLYHQRPKRLHVILKPPPHLQQDQQHIQLPTHTSVATSSSFAQVLSESEALRIFQQAMNDESVVAADADVDAVAVVATADPTISIKKQEPPLQQQQQQDARLLRSKTKPNQSFGEKLPDMLGKSETFDHCFQTWLAKQRQQVKDYWEDQEQQS